MKQIYIFSGLGADERAFKYLEFERCTVTFVKWIMPGKNESMTSYAKRLAEQIINPYSIYIGLSFGGMIAIEVAKIIKPQRLILIASAKSRYEIPFYYLLAGKLRLNNLLPTGLLKRPSLITYWFFGVTNKDDKQLLTEILRDTEKRFLKWAINKIVNWKLKKPPENCIHIHGTADRILPYRFVKATITVNGGGHFMTVNKADELNRIINQLLINTPAHSSLPYNS